MKLVHLLNTQTPVTGSFARKNLALDTKSAQASQVRADLSTGLHQRHQLGHPRRNV